MENEFVRAAKERPITRAVPSPKNQQMLLGAHEAWDVQGAARSSPGLGSNIRAWRNETMRAYDPKRLSSAQVTRELA